MNNQHNKNNSYSNIRRNEGCLGPRIWDVMGIGLNDGSTEVFHLNAHISGTGLTTYDDLMDDMDHGNMVISSMDDGFKNFDIG